MALNRRLISGPISPVVDAGRDYASFRQKCVADKQEFLEHLTKIIETECPECKSAFRPVAAALAQQIACDRAFADVQSRGVEDINDISERFAIVVRASNVYATAKKDLQNSKQRFETARQKLQQDRAMGGRNAMKLEQLAIKAKDEVKGRITDLKEAIEQYIIQKEKFAEFRMRRLREAFVHIGQGTSAIMRQDVEAWKQLEAAIDAAANRFRDAVDTGAPVDDGDDTPIDTNPKVEYVPQSVDPTPTSSAPASTPQPQAEPEPAHVPEPEPYDYGYHQPAAEEDPYKLPYDMPSQTPAQEPQHEEPRREEYNPFDNPFE